MAECVKNGDVIYMFNAIYGEDMNKDYAKYSLNVRKYVVQQMLNNKATGKILNSRICTNDTDFELEAIRWMCWGVTPKDSSDPLLDMEFVFDMDYLENLKETPHIEERFRKFMEDNELTLPPRIAELFLKNIGSMHDDDGEGRRSNRKLLREYIRKFTEEHSL